MWFMTGGEGSGAVENLAIQLRDLLRVVVPGIVGTLFLYWDARLLMIPIPSVVEDKLLFGSIALLIGLAGMSLQMHANLPPWRSHWKASMGKIASELAEITDDSQLRSERNAKNIYKTWVDMVCPNRVKGDLHYKTGAFFMCVELAVFSLLAALPLLGVLVELAIDAVRINVDILTGSTCQWAALSFFVLVGLSSSFYAYSFKILASLEAKNLVIMNLPDSRVQLAQVAEGAYRAGRVVTEPAEMQRVVKQAVAKVRPLDVHTVSSISLIDRVEQYDLRTDIPVRIGHVTVHAATLEAARKINGQDNLYDGPTQRIIQSQLRDTWAERLGVRKIRLQVVPDRELGQVTWPPSRKKPIEPVPLARAIELGIIRDNGAVAECCRELDLKHILLRNGQVVGPSPGLRDVLRAVLRRLRHGEVVFDPFAGTYLTAAVCERFNPQFEAQCNDRFQPDGTLKRYDAFKQVPNTKFGAVVLDPLYEDLFLYLNKCLPKLKYTYLIVQAGDVSDVTWTNHVAASLDRVATRVQDADIPDGTRYGSLIYVYHRDGSH